MARLPQPGGDNGTWGQVLNEFLDVSHDTDGTIKANAVDSSAIQNNSISGIKLQDDSVTNAKLNVGSGLDGQVLTKDSVTTGGFKWSSTSGGTPATTSSLGTIQLAGDLAGTAMAPTVPALASKQAQNADLTAIASLSPSNDDILQRKAGAWTNRTPAQVKTDLVLAKGDVGLGSVDNTSDANKPVSSATTTALNAKADKTTTVSAGTGLTGGGDLSANRTLTVSYGATAGTAAQGNDGRITGAEQTVNKGAANGYAGLSASSRVPTAQLGSGTADTTTYLRGDGSWTAAPSAPVTSVAGKTGVVTLVEGDIANLVTDLAATEKTANKGIASGYASLDGSIKVPIAQIPTGTSSTTVAVGNDSRITGAEQTTNKAAANGYASLNSSTHVPTAQLGSGTADGTTYLRGDGTWTTTPAAPVTSVAGKTGVVTLVKGDVGLGNVDNTSDASKPVSTAQQTALDGKTSTTNGGGETYFDAGNSGTAITLNLANGNVQKLTLTGNCTITLTSPATGAYRSMLIYAFQDATGTRTITWPVSVKWGTAGAPTLSTAATKMDKILLDTVDGGTTWYGSVGPGGF